MAKSKKKQHDEIVKECVDKFKASWGYAESNYHTKWENAWKLYNSQRVHRSYEGVTDTFVPMVFSTIETMVAALGNGRPNFDFEPQYHWQESDTKALNALVDNYWDIDGWDAKIVGAIRQMLITGTAPLFFYWDIDKPRMIDFSPRDLIVDPCATSPDNWSYAGRRYLTSMKELESYEVVDPDTGEVGPRFSNLKNVVSSSDRTEEETDKQRKEMLLGSTNPNEDDTVEVLEIWTHDRVYSVANRSVLIEDIENPYKVQARLNCEDNPRGIIPFVVLRNYTDQSLFYGMGEIEPIKKPQELLNDLTNQYVDAITHQLNPMWTLDPDQISWIDKVESVPGRVYPFKKGVLEPITPPVISQNAFSERLNIKNEIREASAVDQVVKGVAATSAATATEVKAQLNQAGQRIEIKAKLLEKDGFLQMGRLLFRMIRLFVTEEQMVRVNTNQGKQFISFDPERFYGEYIPSVQLEITKEANALQSQTAAKETYLALIQDPTNNLKEIKIRLLPKMFPGLDAEDVMAIVTPDPNQMMPGIGMPGEELPPEGMPMEGEMPMPMEQML